MNASLRRHTLRLSLIAGALASALSAHAWIIQVNGTINGANIVTGTTYKFSDLAALNNTFAYVFNVNGAGAITATIANGASTLSLVNIAGTNVGHANNNTFSYSGEWTATNVANLPIKPTGTYSGIFDTAGGNFSVQFAGDSVVPEPASLAALAVGGVALVRRRRRS